MTQIDDILEQAKSMIPETYAAILAREVEKLRAENATLTAERDLFKKEAVALAKATVATVSEMQNIRDNSLNPAHAMTKQGLEECLDACHKIATRHLIAADRGAWAPE